VPFYDLSPAELVEHTSGTQAPDDLADFWAETLAESRAAATAPTAVPVDSGLPLVSSWDVTFSGFGGQPVRAWLHRPASASAALPLVVRFQGYGGGRGLAHQIPLWTLAGYACLDVDTRGQGSGYSPGDTADPVGSGPAYPGYMTRGVLDPYTYYYRRVFTDAVLSLDAAQVLPGLDIDLDLDFDRVAVIGASQGGAIAIAVAALRPEVAAVLSDVPFLSDFRRAAEIAPSAPYTELSDYLSIHRDHTDQVFRTLAYFDTTVLGATAHSPALFSVALMDEISPPSTVYAAYNAYAGPKEIRTYPFNDHEGGQAFHEVEQLAFVRARFGAVGS
jgi:cephalosporin-C deacetylase